MTFMDAIRANPTFKDLPVDLLEVAFINRGVESSDDYTESGLKNLELVTADVYVEVAGQPDIKEGGLSLKFNPTLLLGRARNIYLKYEDSKIDNVGGRKLNLKVRKK